MTTRLRWAAIALLAVGGLAAAQDYPSKPIRLIVGYPPGGGIDFAARTVQVPLQDALKTNVVIDYKPGASGMIAATELTRAAPDGYTLLLANTGPFAIAPYLQVSASHRCILGQTGGFQSCCVGTWQATISSKFIERKREAIAF